MFVLLVLLYFLLLAIGYSIMVIAQVVYLNNTDMDASYLVFLLLFLFIINNNNERTRNRGIEEIVFDYDATVLAGEDARNRGIGRRLFLTTMQQYLQGEDARNRGIEGDCF